MALVASTAGTRFDVSPQRLPKYGTHRQTRTRAEDWGYHTVFPLTLIRNELPVRRVHLASLSTVKQVNSLGMPFNRAGGAIFLSAARVNTPKRISVVSQSQLE